MSLKSTRVKLEAGDEDGRRCSVKREPELLQAPNVAWLRAEITAPMHTVKQELIVERASNECSGNKTEASTQSNLHQEHAIKTELKRQPGCVKKEEENEEEKEVSEAAAQAGLHAFKRELVLEPKLLDITFAPIDRGVSGECPGEGPRCSESRRERTCSVRLERMSLGKHGYMPTATGVFPNETALVKYERADTADKPHKCHVCDKRFSTNNKLKNHSRIHTGEKPYECVVCHKRFTQSAHLVTHKRTHTGERPYKCVVCHKRFTQSGYLISHTRIHTGELKCNICNKQFVGYNYLLRHERLHTRKNPHKCDICYKKFAQSHSLTEHRRIHTEELKCDICNEQFADLSYLVTHIRIHQSYFT